MSETAWMVFGFIGHGIFFSRLLTQWVMSERAGRPVIPLAYWYLSLAGAAMVLAYAFHRDDPVFIVAHVVSLGIYARQLVLHGRSGAPLPEGEPCPVCGKPLAPPESPE